MLQELLGGVAAKPRDVEILARRLWTPLLRLDGDQRTHIKEELCDLLESRSASIAAIIHSAGASASLTDVYGNAADVADAFLYVYLAAVHTILAGLSTPLAWQGAATSCLRAGVPRPAAIAVADAEFLLRTVESGLLHQASSAQLLFAQLLAETGMGVPLLSLVLRGYSEAALVVTAQAHAAASDSAVVQRCLAHLRLAMQLFTTAQDAGTSLTVAHPIYLHLARVSGQERSEALHLVRQPLIDVSPITSGIRLADYVIYYAEAALLLMQRSDYAAAFYALAPVYSLSCTRGLAREGHYLGGSGVGGSAHPRSVEEGSVHFLSLPEEAEGGGGTQSVSVVPPTIIMPSIKSSHYPWYRIFPVSRPHTTQQSRSRTESSANGSREVKVVVEWIEMLSPSIAEVTHDAEVHAWAGRLSLLLLLLVFGGGSPAELLRHVGASSRSVRSVGGTPSAAADGSETPAIPRATFAHPFFTPLLVSTRVTLEGVLTAAEASGSGRWRSEQMQPYLALARAVAERDQAAAQRCLTGAAAEVFAADLVLDVARVAVQQFLPQHVALDVARVYQHVPLQLLVSRMKAARTAVKGKEEEEEQSSDSGSAHEVLFSLARLCDSGELKMCDVCQKSDATPEAVSSTPVTAFITSPSFAHVSVNVQATSIKLAVASEQASWRACARLVQLESISTAVHRPASSERSLLSMLNELQNLQKVIDREQGRVAALVVTEF